jgi:nicotinamidase-related amidase
MDNFRPDQKPGTALLLIDVITNFEFEDGEKLLARTLPMARRLAALKKKLRSAGVPSVYVNDNWGKWQEDFRSIVERFSGHDAKGREVVEILRPEENDYYILKPHRSAFYSTSLMLLLENLDVGSLIVAGVTTDICVLFSANDAYMRGFRLWVPSDCVEAVQEKHTTDTLAFIGRVLKAETAPSTEPPEGFGLSV